MGAAFYASGLNTALFGFLTVFIACFIVFIKNHSNWKQIVNGIFAIVVFSFLLVNLPEILLKSKNSKFVF